MPNNFCDLTLPYFGQRLQQSLWNKGYSHEEFGKKLGVAQSTVTTWCNDYHYPQANRLYLICQLLDVSADYLLGLEDK